MHTCDMKMIVVFVALFFFFFFSSSQAHTQGTVTVDTFTFGKVIEQFDIVLAKFDDKFPFGDKQEQFKKFAESAAINKRLLIAEIPITDHGDKENEQLAKDYDVKKENYPAYKLFLKGQSKPIDYTGDNTEDDLKRFVTKHTDLWFGLPGTLEGLDRLARDFFDASSSNDENSQKTLLEKARDQVKELVDPKEQKSGDSYLKIMETALKQGPEFLKREGRRVQNLLKGKLTNQKKEELQQRSNILSSFKSVTETLEAVKDQVVDAAEQVKEAVVDAAEQVKGTVLGDKDL